MISDAVFTETIRFLVLNIIKLNAQTAALALLLRQRGVSAEQMKAADDWANAQLTAAHQALEQFQSATNDQSLLALLRAFSGPIQ